MRPLTGLLSVGFGTLLATVLVVQIKSDWLVSRIFHTESMIFGSMITAVVLMVAACCMAVGGAALLLEKQWSLRLVNRAATLVVLALLCFCSLLAFDDISAASERPVGGALLSHWGRGMAAAVFPLFVVWWTGRYIGTPVAELSWTRRQNEKRGRNMSGQCQQCHAWLNFATGAGVESLPDHPFKLRCVRCHRELTLTDAAG